MHTDFAHKLDVKNLACPVLHESSVTSDGKPNVR
jgi:hypothetical protein